MFCIPNKIWITKFPRLLLLRLGGLNHGYYVAALLFFQAGLKILTLASGVVNLKYFNHVLYHLPLPSFLSQGTPRLNESVGQAPFPEEKLFYTCL
jgi:hypothetical protein